MHSLGEAFEVFPELRILFDELLLGDRQPVAKKEVLEGIAMQNVEDMEGVGRGLEIEPVIARAQSVDFLAGTMEATQGLPRSFHVGGLERGDRLNDGKLRELIESVELAHRLGGEGNLVHRSFWDEFDWRNLPRASASPPLAL